MLAYDLEALIEREYWDGGYHAGGEGLGWRLLASPVSVLDTSEIAFIGLNPGGSEIDPAHPRLAPTESSAYVTEAWAGAAPGQSPLQRQICLLFAALDVRPDAVLAGNLVPFRSASWHKLQNRSRALAFGKRLWTQILRQSGPSLVIAMGQDTFSALTEILEIESKTEIRSGWGSVGIRLGENGRKKLVGLPHLSRFSIVGRSQSEDALARSFGDWWKKPTILNR
ncbi:MAG: hypothetical protein FD175_788 [Beijerinckiaceae bacterium]|nr:MAG: hypothetical protein FD175_788 [Beijerinckiaceae bacterium]